MRWARRAVACMALAAGVLPAPGSALAQEVPSVVAPALDATFQSPVLTIDQKRLFEDSAFGLDSLTRLEAASRDLQAEIRKIESDLEIEERMLTERRAAMETHDFQPLARAFDEKVESIRAAWGAKDRDLKRQRDADQQTFFEFAVPVLAELMREMGAVLLIDQSSIVLSFDRVDITQIAIARLDARLAATQSPDTTPADPAPTDGPATNAPVQGDAPEKP